MKKAPVVLALILTLFLFRGILVPSASEAAVARAGAGGTAQQAAGLTMNVTIPSTTAGNTLIAVVGVANNNGNRVTGITGGGTWVKARSGGNAGGAIEADIWYCPNIAAGVTTVTVTINLSVAMGAVVQEYSGVLTAAPLDVTAINNTSGGSASQTSGTTAATAQGNELWVAGFGVAANGAYSAPGAGWAIANQVARNSVSTALLDDMFNTAGAASASVTGPNAVYVGTIATFKSTCPPGSNWTATWNDLKLTGDPIINPAQTFYSLTAPCVAYAGVPFNITATVTDSTHPSTWVASGWSISDFDGSTTTVLDSGFMLTTSALGQWQDVLSRTYAGSTNANHTITFTAMDLGIGGSGHFAGSNTIGDLTIDPELPPTASLIPNISAAEKYAWAETSGWINFAPANGGITVMPTYLWGYAWAENIGWVKLGNDNGGPYDNTGNANWGVNRAADGKLSGFGWSENTGWINFAPKDAGVTIGADGKFSGYAWGENIGWISLRNDIIQNPYGIAIVQFTITLDPQSGGGITCDPASPVPQGWNVACTISPSEGYYATSLTDGQTVVNDPPLTYNLSGLSGAHTLVVTFAEYPVKRLFGGSYDYAKTPAEAVGKVAADNEAVLLRESGFAGPIDLSQPWSIFFEGGYPSWSGDNSGLFSTISGQLIFSNGGVTIENIIVQ